MHGLFPRRRLLGLAAIMLALLLFPLIAIGENGVVSTSSLVLRSKASADSAPLQTLSRGTSLQITGTSGQWYRVSYGKYRGYVMKKYVTLSGSRSSSSSSKSGSSQQTSKEKSLIATLRSIGRPKACTSGSSGDTESNVKKLQRCLTACGYYKGKIDGVYGSSTRSAVSRLQRAKGLNATGIATKQTIGAMFGEKLPEDYVTERLDWFHGGQDRIPKGAVFQVKDCWTGRIFQCRRWSGANHMDSMPLTKDDTRVMKSIYGQWSWRRRPVLVMYQGRVYAASMNGMPHGTTTIKNNNFPGHFCIHFYGSMTHGTKRVDENHQSCVSTAMHYAW
ncbi:MAG: peptidoglycan-binding protein [Clostridia bacterium]|nr:peptidoglycan-binding protein [Clostridia bacterium]